MSLPLVKQVLSNAFWDYPAYIPKPTWENFWLDVREVNFLSIMRRTAQKPPIPLPRFWQGLRFNIMDCNINGSGTCTYQQTDNTFSINLESCHSFVKRPKKTSVNSGRSFGKSCSIHFVDGRPIVLGVNDGFKIKN